ncbi:MAG TPA: extracellular solute-binding protein [Firmicutes bacterium]|nr:extracellular solute-binding protein [Bacillota bacterium]
MKFTKRLLATVCALALFSTMALPSLAAEDTGADTDADASVTVEQAGQEGGSSAGTPSYYDYILQYQDTARPSSEISINAADFISDEGAGVEIGSYEGKDNVVLWDSQEGKLTWQVNVPESGLYNMALVYAGIELKGNDIQVELTIDGKLPHTSADSLTYPRLYHDEVDPEKETDGRFEIDSQGNEVRPDAVETFAWQTYETIDTDGVYNGPLQFYLEEGTHTISLEMKMEAFALSEIRFYPPTDTVSYADKLAEWEAQGAKDSSGYSQKYEAELMESKSSNLLYPTYDKGSVSMSPSDPYVTLYNTMGKDTWKSVGQEATWKISVPEDGYYYLSFKARQNSKRGMYSTRELYIDGEIPYEELGNIRFPYRDGWYMQTVEDDSGEPLKVFLTAGEHTLTLRAVTGDIADILRRVENAVTELNQWYRQIIMITGSNADSERITIDTNRDFMLEDRIPGLMDGFRSIVKSLDQALSDVEEMYGGDGTAASLLSEMIAMLEKFIKRPDTIAKRLESYRGNVSSLATWVLDQRDQPLALDYFVVYSPDQEEPKASTNFFSQIAYRAEMFYGSFVIDYNSIGGSASGENGEPLEVWMSTGDLTTVGVSTGRDQAQLLKRLIDDMFTPDSGIGVNLSLVTNSTTLIQATLAGKGPDVAVFVSKDTPVNLAMRNALVPLDQFDDFEQVTEQFMASAMIPYKYGDHYYAFPETQAFDMLFYRTDVFEELGLEPPETWDDFYELIATLQQSNMLVGIPEAQRIFEALLYQKGGQFYTDDLSATTFDQPVSLEAFKTWTDLYTKYSLPLVFDFFSRFRTGEMPMAIMPYTQVNYLAVSAPELEGLWAVAPIPGTVEEDGTVNNTETAVGTAAVILGNTEQPDEAYEFLKWWVSTEAQGRFGVEIEQNMGPASRYPTANVAAFDQLPWTKVQADNLKAQWEVVTDVPQIPGNYYITRNVSFAFRQVVLKDANVRETLNKYNKEINKEITRKREEFSLNG